MNDRKAFIFALISALLWSTVATAFKYALQFYEVFEILMYSSFVSFIVISVYGIYIKKFHSAFKTSLKNHLSSIILGALNPFAYYLILFKAYDLLPAQEAQTLNYSWSITVVIFSYFILKQKIKIRNWLALILSFFGVIIIATKGNILALKFENEFGVFLAIISSIFWGLYWVLNLKDSRESIQKLILNFFYGTIFIFIANVLFNDNYVGFSGNIIYCIYIGLFEMGITFILWMSALKFASNSAKVSTIIFVSPFLSLFWINLLLDETIKITTIAGLILIISGILIQTNFKTNQSTS